MPAAYEVRDYVIGPDLDALRMHNEAAITELVRRGEPPPLLPSGEIPPYSIDWRLVLALP